MAVKNHHFIGKINYSAMFNCYVRLLDGIVIIQFMQVYLTNVYFEDLEDMIPSHRNISYVVG